MEKTSQILVMDEPTSNYDSNSCASFNEFIRRDTSYDYYFIVTHDPTVLNSVDRVVRVENGKITVQDQNEEYVESVWAVSEG